MASMSADEDGLGLVFGSGLLSSPDPDPDPGRMADEEVDGGDRDEAGSLPLLMRW